MYLHQWQPAVALHMPALNAEQSAGGDGGGPVLLPHVDPAELAIASDSMCSWFSPRTMRNMPASPQNLFQLLATCYVRYDGKYHSLYTTLCSKLRQLVNPSSRAASQMEAVPARALPSSTYQKRHTSSCIT